VSDRLLLDAMLGKLATYLRLCGYDAAYVLDDRDGDQRDEQRASDGDDERTEEGSRATVDPGDDEIADWARASGRTLLTRDVDLAAQVDGAVLLTSRDVGDQLRELVAAGYELSLADPPARCAACNGRLHAVGSGESTPPYAPDSAATDCWRCRDCEQVFWKGSHWDDVRDRLDAL
jgi:uncharacterized protein with PIN domain